MIIKQIRISTQAKEQLIRLKTRTGIAHWNVLCRWAFCFSLRQPSPPAALDIPADSNVEMTWTVFGGDAHEIDLALLKERCERDGLSSSDEVLARQFRLHLHRGIGYLAAPQSIRSIGDLVQLATGETNGNRSTSGPDLAEDNMDPSQLPSGRFVVQKHRARTLHYDFRLEKDGVLKSWAVPKGIPETIGPRRLAVQVPDHPLAYGSFEGTIPEGQYGAGTVEIWDEGTYELLEWTDASIQFILHGHRVQGTYSLVRFQNKGPRDWLLFRRHDEIALGTKK